MSGQQRVNVAVQALKAASEVEAHLQADPMAGPVLLRAAKEYATAQCALVSALADPGLAAKLRAPLDAKLQAVHKRLAALEKRGGNAARIAAEDAEAAWVASQEIERWSLVMVVLIASDGTVRWLEWCDCMPELREHC